MKSESFGDKDKRTEKRQISNRGRADFEQGKSRLRTEEEQTSD